MATTISIEINKNGNLSASINSFDKIKTIRSGKGKSIMAFPDTYVVVDIETTGLSPEYDEIIEIAAIRYKNGVVVDKYTSLVKPSCEIDEYITELTGISNEMVENAPDIDRCIRELYDYLGKDLIVGYNVNFDINFLYDNLLRWCSEEFGNDFIDVMRIAKRIVPGLPHYRQKDVAEYYGIENNIEHRAETDCVVCEACFERLREDALKKEIDISIFNSYKGVKAKDISTKNTEFDEEHPLYGKVCVFTGTLEKLHRKDAMQLVADLGGIPADGVTKKTNYLVLGNNDYCKTIKDGKSAKQKKAEKLILSGADLQIISEQVFYDLALDG